MKPCNILAEDYYCDPHHRRITSVTVRSIGDGRVDGSNINMEFLVEGTCQGCDPDSVTLFDKTTPTDGRFLIVKKRVFDKWSGREKDEPTIRERSLRDCFCENELFEKRDIRNRIRASLSQFHFGDTV
jgi:hypothetical protein